MDVATPVTPTLDPARRVARTAGAAHGTGRIVAYRPTSPWPQGRRPTPRIRDPFRAFPQRRVHLIALMYGGAAERSADRRPTR